MAQRSATSLTGQFLLKKGSGRRVEAHNKYKNEREQKLKTNSNAQIAIRFFPLQMGAGSPLPFLGFRVFLITC